MNNEKLEHILDQIGHYSIPDSVILKAEALWDEFTRNVAVNPSAVRTRSLRSKQSIIKVNFKIAAAAVMMLIISIAGIGIFIGPLDKSGVAWAEVVRQIEAGKTLIMYTVEERTTSLPGKPLQQNVTPSRQYIKDPGMLRRECYDTYVYSPDWSGSFNKMMADSNVPTMIEIELLTQGQLKSIFIYPQNKDYQRSIITGNGAENRPFDLAATFWEKLTKIPTEKTRFIGNQKINGVSVTGFEISMQDFSRELYRGTFEGTVQVWADNKTDLPVLVEIQICWDNYNFSKITLESFEWNVPIPDELFQEPSDLPLRNEVCWERELFTFSRSRLRPGVTVAIGIESEEPILTEKDIEFVEGVQIQNLIYGDIPGDVPPHRVCVRLIPTPAGKEKLQAVTEANMGKKLVIDFNHQVINEMKFLVPFNIVELDIASLSKTPKEFEDEFLVD
jgi:hypothetical protein